MTDILGNVLASLPKEMREAVEHNIGEVYKQREGEPTRFRKCPDLIGLRKDWRREKRDWRAGLTGAKREEYQAKRREEMRRYRERKRSIQGGTS